MTPKRSPLCLPLNLCLFVSKFKAKTAAAGAASHSMAIPAVVAILPVGVLFILSGLIVNLMQMVCFLLVRPVSKSMYRKINKLVAELLWLELIWLIDWWAGIKACFFLKVVHVYAFTSHLLNNIIADLSFSSRSFFEINAPW
ncbi:hypothetical protein ACFX15_029513 [Malus domestica]